MQQTLRPRQASASPTPTASTPRPPSRDRRSITASTPCSVLGATEPNKAPVQPARRGLPPRPPGKRPRAASKENDAAEPARQRRCSERPTVEPARQRRRSERPTVEPATPSEIPRVERGRLLRSQSGERTPLCRRAGGRQCGSAAVSLSAQSGRTLRSQSGERGAAVSISAQSGRSLRSQSGERGADVLQRRSAASLIGAPSGAHTSLGAAVSLSRSPSLDNQQRTEASQERPAVSRAAPPRSQPPPRAQRRTEGGVEQPAVPKALARLSMPGLTNMAPASSRRRPSVKLQVVDTPAARAPATARVAGVAARAEPSAPSARPQNFEAPAATAPAPARAAGAAARAQSCARPTRASTRATTEASSPPRPSPPPATRSTQVSGRAVSATRAAPSPAPAARARSRARLTEPQAASRGASTVAVERSSAAAPAAGLRPQRKRGPSRISYVRTARPCIATEGHDHNSPMRTSSEVFEHGVNHYFQLTLDQPLLPTNA